MKSNNQINIPQAREAMDKFKMQAASEVGVNLTNGYNGHLTSREAGSVGGQMVKNNCPMRSMSFERHTLITGLLIRLGVDPETAADDACRIEHAISDASFEAIKRFTEGM